MADEPHQCRLPDNCSIFRAELFAIEKALKLIKTDGYSRYAVYSDSLSCLEKLSYINMSKLDPVLTKIVDTLQYDERQNK